MRSTTCMKVNSQCCSRYIVVLKYDDTIVAMFVFDHLKDFSKGINSAIKNSGLEDHLDWVRRLHLVLASQGGAMCVDLPEASNTLPYLFYELGNCKRVEIWLAPQLYRRGIETVPGGRASHLYKSRVV